LKLSRFVLLDRDGVINRRIPNGYVTSWAQFEFLPRALEALRLLVENNHSAIVISNQACVGKGLLTPEGLDAITGRFLAEVQKYGGRIDGIYYCPHRIEDGCGCRKPKPGLLVQAQRDFGFSFPETFMVGDSENDLLAAQQVGCPALLISDRGTNANAQWPYPPRAVVRDLYSAVLFILERRKRPQDPTAPPDS
jgi:histidinol-phosphate phosphatase family protein